MHQKMNFGVLQQDRTAHQAAAMLQASAAAHSASSAEGQMAVGHAPVAQTTKECPVCHARCFADMAVCYNCLHSFAQEGDRPMADRGAVAGAPRETVSSLNADGAWSSEGDASFASIEDGASGSPWEDSVCYEGREKDTLPGAKQVIEVVVNVSFPQGFCRNGGSIVPKVTIESR